MESLMTRLVSFLHGGENLASVSIVLLQDQTLNFVFGGYD